MPLKISKYIILLLISFIEINAQGFDWQYSARMPAESPRRFLGINLSTSYAENIGDINLSELKIPCCNFDNGSGMSLGFGVSGEYWLTGIEAVTIIAKYNYYSDNFNTDAEPSYYVNDTMFTNFDLNTKRHHLSLDFRYKYRLYESHFSISGGLIADILLAKSFKISENVISVNDAFNDGTTSRTVKNGTISSMNVFNISPEIAFSYDFTFGKGMYASPYIMISYPLISYAADRSWRSFNISLGINLFRGF